MPAHHYQPISPNLQIDPKDSQFSNKNNHDKLSGENEKNPDARNGLLGETAGGGGGDNDSWLGNKKECDLYKGTWVKDEQYPIYKPGSCPFVDEAFDCQHNGRPDSEYLKWRWKPDGCDLPRFVFPFHSNENCRVICECVDTNFFFFNLLLYCK